MDNPLVETMEPYASTIFSEMSELASRTGAVNLGQGFPDIQGPDFLVDLACEAIRAGHNQYAPRSGVPELRRREILPQTGEDADPFAHAVTVSSSRRCS